MPCIQFEGAVPVRHSHRTGRARCTIVFMYAGLAVLLVLGMLATKHADGPVSEDRRAARGHARTGWKSCAGTRRCIADEFFDGLQAVERIDRPAVSIFGSARVREDSTPYRIARDDGARVRRGGLGGRDRRRPRRDGGREPRLPGGRRPQRRLQHRAAARAAARIRISTSRSPSATSTRARRCS